MNNLARISWTTGYSFLLCVTATGFAPDPVHDPASGGASDEPAVTDPGVRNVSDQIDSSAGGVQTALIDWLVSASVSMDDQTAAQALYVAGHKNYGMERFTEADQAFQDLAAIAPGTLLEVDALRMRAQIDIALGDLPQAITKYQSALAVVDAVQGVPEIRTEVSLLSFLPMMSVVYESLGDHAGALSAAERVLLDVHLDSATTREAIRRAGRASMALGATQDAQGYYQRYLDEYPDDGWTNGVRIEAERRVRVCQGMIWGLGYAEEAQFCADVLANAAYRNDPARYGIGNHLIACLMKRDQGLAAEEVVLSLLAQAQADITAAGAAGNEQLRLELKRRAEGQTRHAYVRVLDLLGRTADAHAQVSLLASDPEYGPYSQVSSLDFGLEPLP